MSATPSRDLAADLATLTDMVVGLAQAVGLVAEAAATATQSDARSVRALAVDQLKGQEQKAWELSRKASDLEAVAHLRAELANAEARADELQREIDAAWGALAAGGHEPNGARTLAEEVATALARVEARSDALVGSVRDIGKMEDTAMPMAVRWLVRRMDELHRAEVARRT